MARRRRKAWHRKESETSQPGARRGGIEGSNCLTGGDRFGVGTWGVGVCVGACESLRSKTQRQADVETQLSAEHGFAAYSHVH